MYHNRDYYDSQFRKYDPNVDLDYLRKDCRSNCEWFGHHHELGDDRTFLDVGTWHGAALDVMQQLGWAVHGFDVSEPPFMGPHITVGPLFHRWLFPRRYAAVLAREVWEHTPFPDLMLHELHGVCQPGGLVQIQTPRSMNVFHDIPYQKQHLFVASESQTRKMLNAAMLDVIDFRLWDHGQAYLCRARS